VGRSAAVEAEDELIQVGLEMRVAPPMIDAEVAVRCAAQNHTVSGSFKPCIAVGAVTEVCRRHLVHSWVYASVSSSQAWSCPQAGQRNPSGHRAADSHAAQAASSGNCPWNSNMERGKLGIANSPIAVSS
jgi:hypothetical protein